MSGTSSADCFLCTKAKVQCDQKVPCSRCEQMKVPHMCLSAINKRLNSSSYSSTKIDPSFVLNELNVMKKEQKKLYEEVAALRKQNERLEMALASASAAAPSPAQAISDGGSRSPEDTRPAPILRMGRAVTGIDMLTMQDQAIVIFDLSQNPATVLNATEKFCQFLGYIPEEVIGMAWQKFIHPDFVGRTMQILKRNMNNPVELEQMYRHKDGQALLDIVSVRVLNVDQGLPAPKTSLAILFVCFSLHSNVPLIEAAPLDIMPSPSITSQSPQTTQRAQQRSSARPRPYVVRQQPQPQQVTPQPYLTQPQWLTEPTSQMPYNTTPTQPSDFNSSMFYFNSIAQQMPPPMPQQMPSSMPPPIMSSQMQPQPQIPRQEDYSHVPNTSPYTLPMNSTSLPEYTAVPEHTLLDDPSLDVLSTPGQSSQKTLSDDDLFQMLMDNSSSSTDHGSTMF